MKDALPPGVKAVRASAEVLESLVLALAIMEFDEDFSKEWKTIYTMMEFVNQKLQYCRILFPKGTVECSRLVYVNRLAKKIGSRAIGALDITLKLLNKQLAVSNHEYGKTVREYRPKRETGLAIYGSLYKLALPESQLAKHTTLGFPLKKSYLLMNEMKIVLQQ